MIKHHVTYHNQIIMFTMVIQYISTFLGWTLSKNKLHLPGWYILTMGCLAVYCRWPSSVLLVALLCRPSWI